MVQSSSAQQSSVIRVLIANASASLEEWLERLAQTQDDIEIVGRVRGYVEILVAAQVGVDVVVLSEPESEQPPGIFSHLLAQYPEIRILNLNPVDHKAKLYWLGQHQKELSIVSAKTLLVTLRQLDAVTNTHCQ